jgi:hypothetical protein
VTRLPGLRRGSRLRRAILVAWTLFSALGVLVGITTPDERSEVVAFYAIAYVVGIAAAWMVAIAWEKGQPRRSARAAARVERHNSVREAREQSQRAADAEREVKERERLAAARARSAQAAEAEAARRAAAEAKAAEVTQAKAARRAAAEAKAAEVTQAKAARRAAVEAKTSQAAEAERARTAAAESARAQTTRGAEMVLTLTPEQARLVEAARLRERLAAGDPPPRLDPGGIVLRKDEVLVAREPATLWEFRGQAVQYRQGGALFFGSPLFLIGSLAASAAVSGAARTRARRAAAAQWRSIDSGSLLLTTQRLSFMGSAGWRDIPFTTIRAVECEVDALALHCDGVPPFRVAMEYPEVMFILLNHVAWGRLPETRLPPDLAERV